MYHLKVCMTELLYCAICELSLPTTIVLVHKRQLQEYEDRNVGPPLKKIKNKDSVKSLSQGEMQEVESNISGIMNTS